MQDSGRQVKVLCLKYEFATLRFFSSPCRETPLIQMLCFIWVSLRSIQTWLFLLSLFPFDYKSTLAWLRDPNYGQMYSVSELKKSVPAFPKLSVPQWLLAQTCSGFLLQAVSMQGHSAWAEAPTVPPLSLITTLCLCKEREDDRSSDSHEKKGQFLRQEDNIKGI